MKAELIELPKVADPRGNLTFIQNPEHIPFSIERVFWTYDVPGGFVRGGHAYKTNHELIIALSGSFDVVLLGNDGNTKSINLKRSYQGLIVPANQWRRLENFSTNSVSLHLSSGAFDKQDYIREISEL
jgi:hypothetical protein